MIPLSKIYVNGEEIKELKKVIESGWWAGNGPKVEELENKIKKYLELPEDYNVCAVSNCHAALTLCLLYYDVKDLCVGVPSYSHVSSAFCINHCDARPIFIDIKKDGFNIDIGCLEEVVKDAKIKYLIVVHQYGIPAEIEEINKIAQEYDIKIIEDAAPAFGSKINYQFVGTHGNLTCFSLQARKTLTCGEGGFIVIPPEVDADWFFSMRSFGMDLDDRKSFIRKGYNFRLTDLQAAVAIAQLSDYDKQLEKRNNLASLYCDKIFEEKLDYINLPIYDKEDYINWQTFRVLVDKNLRDGLLHILNRKGIKARVCTQPIHKQIAYNSCEKLFNTEDVAERGIWLPFYTDMTNEEVCEIIDILK